MEKYIDLYLNFTKYLQEDFFLIYLELSEININDCLYIFNKYLIYFSGIYFCCLGIYYFYLEYIFYCKKNSLEDE